PALVFANDDVSNGTTTTNFKVQINWGDSSTPSVYTHSDSSTSQGLLYQSDNIYLIRCSSNTPTAYSTTSASTKTITIEGGWGSGDYDDASRKLAFPKQITTRFTDNLFLNYKKDITLTTETLGSSYHLAFKFERDYVGLYSCDRLKLVAGKTYTIDSGDTQFTILSDTATFEDEQLVVGSDEGEVDYSFVNGGTTYYSRFEIVNSIDGTSAPVDGKLEKMMTTRHHVESDAYDDITYNSTSVSIINKNIFYEIAIGNNFTLHGIGDFAGYYKPKKIKKISGATRPSVPNVTSHMFAGCKRLETSSFIGDSSGGLSLNNVTDMTGFASGMENYNGFWRLGLPGNNLTNLTGTFEYSNYTTSKIKNFPWSRNKITTIESLFEGTSFNHNVIQSIDVSSIENFKNLFKNNSEFNQYIGAWDTSSALTFEGMFNGAKSYNKYMRKLNTNSVTSMKAMFKNASSFDQDVYSFKTNAVESMEDMFNGASSFNRWINTNTGGANFNTDSVKSMRGMFKNATSFNRKLNKFDTSNVEDMGEMFSGAIIFNRVVSSFNTSKVKSMDYMFEGATEFRKKINTHSSSTKWNTSAVQTMRGMFKNATKFNSEISNFDTTNVTDMAKMFNGATKFAQAITTSSNKWNTSSVTDMSEMFEGASAFNRYIASWDTSSVTKMKGMFKDSSFNKSIKNWTVTSVETMESMFEDNDAFNQEINDWKVNSVGSFKNMFKGATAFDQSLYGWGDNIGSSANEVSLEGMFQSSGNSVPAFNRNISQWNVSKVTSIKNMFKDNTTFSSKIFPGFNLSASKMSDMTNFLDGATGILTSTNSNIVSAISSFGKTTPNADGLHFLFGDDDDGVADSFKSTNYSTKRGEYETSLSAGSSTSSGPSAPSGGSGGSSNGNSGLAGSGHEFTSRDELDTAIDAWNTNSTQATSTYGDINTWDVSAVTDFATLFMNKTNIQNLDLSNWETSQVTTMYFMFFGCTNLKTLNINAWDTSSLSDLRLGFIYCSSIETLNLNNWNVTGVNNLQDVFNGMTSLTTLNIADWNVQNVVSLAHTFMDCSSLKNLDISNWNVKNVTQFGQIFYNCTSLTNSDVDFSNWCINSCIENSNLYGPGHQYYSYSNIKDGCSNLSSHMMWNTNAGFTEEPDWNNHC
ncbi:MAG: BspA family leucine-rich repeat surface protein, partial [Flavobacteriaceae bacterium TMED42]